MHRCCSRFTLVLTITLAIVLPGCLGKSSSNPGNGGVASVSINPASDLSLNLGGTQVFSATAKNASGGIVLGTIQFRVESGVAGTTAPLSIASNGNACAGSWDPSVSQCTPGTSGVALVTAVIDGVSSPPTTVYVHQHIDNLVISQAQSQPPQFDCFSEGQTWLYQAKAFSNGVDITNTIGPLSWSSTNFGVLTPTTLLPNMPLNQVQITADSPGITQLFATVSGTSSNGFPVMTCLVKYVRLRVQGSSEGSISVNNGGAVGIEATAVDTLGFTLTKPPLTWSTTNPEVMAFATLTNTTGANSATARNNLGGADLSASCAPPSCNIGVLPGMSVYSSGGPLPNGLTGFGAISVDVTSTSKPPTYTAWVATTMCGNADGCTSTMFSVTPGTTPITGSASVPRTPNSFMFNFQSSSRVYIGSDQGLMFADVSSNAPIVAPVSAASTPCDVTVCGKVLAISNDGKLVVVSDDVSTTRQVYLFNASTSVVTDLVIPGVTATAAAFSPDQSKIFILTDAGTMYVYSTVDAFGLITLATPGTDVAFAADGSFAYVAGTPGSAVSAFSTCSLPGVPSTDLGFVATSGVPLKIFPATNVQTVTAGGKTLINQNVYVLEPPSIQVLTAQYTQVPIANTLPNTPSQQTCNPPDLQSFVAGPTFNLQQGNFVPLYARLVSNGTEMIIVAQKIPAVLIFNIGNGTTTSIPLVNQADPLAASASTDGSQVYVAACDQYQSDGVTCAAGSTHIVNTLSQGDLQQVPYINNGTNNMCNSTGGTSPLCVANLVAIKPQ